MQKYGCGNNVEKMKQTCQEKYGTDYYVQSDEFKNQANLIKKQKSIEFSIKHNTTPVIDLLSKYGQGWLGLKLHRK